MNACLPGAYPCVAKIAYRGAQEEPVQVCGAGEGSNRRRQKNAGWARSGLHAVQRGRLRPSAARSAEAPDRRAPSPMPCKQTPLMEGAGNADIGEVVNFFYFTLHFYQKDCARVRQKNRSGREQLTPSPPYLRFRSWGLRTPAGGQALIARGQNFQGGGYPMT